MRTDHARPVTVLQRLVPPFARPRWLPRGTPLPDDVWLGRHRAFLVVTWLACAVAFVWATAARGLVHGLLDSAPIAGAALVAMLCSSGPRRWGREASSSAVMLALMAAAAAAVHLSGGLIEAHFLFFVAVGAAASYQTWAPFLTAVGFVVLHHGVLGSLHPRAMFNHPAAQDHPWLWALVHGTLLAAAAAVGIASWRADEVVRERLATVGARSRLIVSTVQDGIVAVDGAGCVVEANPAAVRILEAGPLTGQRLSDLLHGVCDAEQMQQLQSGERSSLPQSGSLHSTASSAPVAVTVAAVRGDDAVRAVVTLRDLSSAARADVAEQALADLAVREQVRREDVAALMTAVRPPALSVEGLEVAVAYQPAASAPAGGDLYDWLVLPSGEVLLVVVDAMGRGTAATREALAVTTTVRTLAVLGCPLGELVARAAAVLDVTHPELLATLLIAVLDPTTGALRLAGGGHPPAVLVTPAGAREVPADGLGIGYPDPGSFGTSEVVLGAGDTLVLYTDGLIEGTRDVTAGLRELASTAAGLAGLPVSQFAERLLTDVVTCALAEDDCLAVVIRRPSAAAVPAQSSAVRVPASAGSGLVREVQSDVAAVRHARAAATTWLRQQAVDQDTVETCVLLVSELVTNAVRHAGTSGRLRLHRDADEVLIEVEDGSVWQPELRDADDGATGGRGLHLVDTLAERWGVVPASNGKTVWCVVAMQSQDRAEAPAPLPALPRQAGPPADRLSRC